MNQSSTQIKEILFDCLNAMSENPWIYTDQNNLFSRKKALFIAYFLCFFPGGKGADCL